MANGKWISDLTPATPLVEGARRVLFLRLGAVRDTLPLALHGPYEDTEHVHQLRVSTRRARVALDMFAPCLPPTIYKKTKKNLRNIRRAAGEARDWDVFLAGLVEWGQTQNPRRRPGLNALIGYALAQREMAQAHLQDLGDDYPSAFATIVTRTLEAVRPPEYPLLSRPSQGDKETRRQGDRERAGDKNNPGSLSPCPPVSLSALAVERGGGEEAYHRLIDLARPVLSGLLDELDGASKGDLEDYEHLHEMRIIGKRLRYAMEVFAGCYGPSFREEFYTAVEQMQEILGSINDSQVAGEHLETASAMLKALPAADCKRFKPGIDSILSFTPDVIPRHTFWS